MACNSSRMQSYGNMFENLAVACPIRETKEETEEVLRQIGCIWWKWRFRRQWRKRSMWTI
jgi:hypothetical protein